MLSSWLTLTVLTSFASQSTAGSNANEWNRHSARLQSATVDSYGIPAVGWAEHQSHDMGHHALQDTNSYQGPSEYSQSTYVEPYGYHARFYPTQNDHHAAGQEESTSASPAHPVIGSLQGMSLVDSLLRRPAMPLPPGVETSSSSSRRQSQRSNDNPRLTLSTQQAAQAIGLDPRRLDRERSFQARRSKAITLRIDLDEVINADLPHLATKPYPNISKERKRRLLMDAWEQRGLNYNMEPEDLARKVAKIKMEIGYDSTIGQLAALKVMEEAPSRDYKAVYQVFNKIYSNRIAYLRRRARECPVFETKQQEARWVYLRVRPIRSFDYIEGIRQNEPRSQQRLQAQRLTRAKRVWEFFMASRVPVDNNDIQEGDNPDVSSIEILSRGLTYRDLTQARTTELIKVYMGVFLGVNEIGLYRFTHQRLRARVASRVGREKEAARIRREGRQNVVDEEGEEDEEEEEQDDNDETYDHLYEDFDVDDDPTGDMSDAEILGSQPDGIEDEDGGGDGENLGQEGSKR